MDPIIGSCDSNKSVISPSTFGVTPPTSFRSCHAMFYNHGLPEVVGIGDIIGT